MQTLAEGLKVLRKDYGEAVGGKGASDFEFPRLPTGILPLDVDLRGGIPMGAVSLIYGPESSGKSSLCLRTVAQYQQRHKRKAVWIDAENCWDSEWSRQHGVDTDSVYYFRPTSAEEAADIADRTAWAEDVGLIVVDSIAALASNDQIEKKADQVVMAGAAKPTTTLLRNLATGMVEHAKAKQPLTVILINQVRERVGITFGNPEILPGPRYQHFLAFLKLRLTAAPVLKEKVAPLPIYTSNTAKVIKKKFSVLRSNSAWETVLYPHAGLVPLQVNNTRHALNMLTETGLVAKNGKDWVGLDGEVFSTQTAAVASALEDYDYLLKKLYDGLGELHAAKAAEAKAADLK